jgi:hypothetical protein
MNKFILCLLLLILSACSSTTHIKSSDPDARIFVNGEYVGTGDAQYTDRKVAFTKNEVAIRKEGCAEANHTFRRDEKPDGGAIVGGILVLVPFLWVTEYKRERAYEYDCVPESVQLDDSVGAPM